MAEMSQAPEGILGESDDAVYMVHGLQPATTYNITAEHPRYTLTGAPNLTTPDWNPPGVLPSTDPELDGDLEPLTLLDVETDFEAMYVPGGATVTFFNEVFNSSLDPPAYQPAGETSIFRYVKTEYTGDNLFLSSSIIPQGPFTAWMQVGDDFFRADVAVDEDFERTIKFGGPAATPSDPAPDPVAVVKFEVISNDDPTFYVPNTTINFANGPSVVTGASTTVPHIDNAYSGATDSIGATATNWLFVADRIRFGDDDADVTVTIFMERAMDMKANVTDATSGDFIEGVSIKVRNRFGDLVTNMIYDEGEEIYRIPAPQPRSQAFYVDIASPGYFPFRQRVTAGDDIQATASSKGDPRIAQETEIVIEVEAPLMRLPKPMVQSKSLNRFGLFLPGIEKSGDQDLFNGEDPTAQAALTADWEVMAQAADPYDINLLDFDAPNGAPGSLQATMVTDPIVEVWLVDNRSFNGNPYNDTVPASTHVPLNDSPAILHEWIGNLIETLDGKEPFDQSNNPNLNPNRIPNVYYQRLQNLNETGSATFGGGVSLAGLPPGEFDPVFVIISQRGAITVDRTFSFDPEDPLNGVRLPPWLAFATESMGVIAATQTGIEEVGNYIPIGRFEALPQFTATIMQDPENAGYLLYNYAIGVNVNEGMLNAASGFLGYGPGVIGLQFNAEASVKVIGKMGTVDLNVSGNITSDEIDASDYFPKSLFGLPLEEPSVKPAGSVSTTAREFITANFGNPLQSQIRHVVNGSAIAKVKANLSPITRKIPYAGPVLYALDKTGVMSISATLDGALSLESQTNWNTLRPREQESVIVGQSLNHTRRRHFLGGNEDIDVSPPAFENRFEVGFNFKVGLLITIEDLLDAQGKISIQGEEKDIPGLGPVPVATILINTQADWPPIESIQGAINLSINATVNLILTELELGWDWDAITFSHEFGTQSSFQLIPLGITVTERNLFDFPPAGFSGDTPTPIDGFLPVGDFAAAPSPGGGMEAVVFSNLNSGTGGMTLGISIRASESNWSAPVTIVSAPGIVGTTVAQLPDARWIVAWVEVDQADLSNPFASTSIKTAVSTNATGQTWQVQDQDVVAVLNSARARQLRLLIGSNMVGLAFLQSTGTPTSTMASVMGATWDGNAWSALTTLVAETGILAFGAIGSGVPGPDTSQIIYAEGQTVRAFEWTGGAPGVPATLSSDANNVVDIHAGETGTFYAAFGLSASGIGLSKFDSGWTDLGTLSATAIPNDIEVAVLTDDTDPSVVAIAWTSGGGPSDISYLFTDTSGTVLQQDTVLTSNSVGHYHDLELIPEQVDRKAILLTLFTASPDELRSFNLSFDNGIAGNDRDGDGMNDIGELLIVDDIPDDAQFDDIADVLPNDDYDNDGFLDVFSGTLRRGC